MKILGFHLLNDTLVNSDGEVCHDNYLDFLLKDTSPDTIKVFYSLDWAVARLCYLLKIPEWQLKKFWTTSSLFHEDYIGFFVPHRYFGLKNKAQNKETNFSDIYQYDASLPFETDPLDAACKAREIGQQVYDALRKLELTPKSLSSPVACFQKEVLSTMDLPILEDVPALVRLYAYECLHGGWQEVWKVGHYDAYDYDLVSAYTRHTADLIDHRYGQWFKSDKFYPQLPFGFCKGRVRINSEFSPVLYESKGQQYTPVGEWDTTLTSQQVKQLYDYGIGQFRISSAWYWKPDKIVYPLKEELETLFEWKAQLEGMEREVVKRLLVGIWGKCSETFNDGDFGKLFNPVWAAAIETGTRTQVADFILKNKLQDNLISIAVDGCLLNKPVEITETGEMGTWRLSSQAPAFVVSSGVGAIRGKVGKGAFSLNYDWLDERIRENGEPPEYMMQKVTPVTIGLALKNNKLDKLGELEVTERAVYVDIENKRFYRALPEHGSDLYKQYDSVAHDVSNIQAEVLRYAETVELVEID